MHTLKGKGRTKACELHHTCGTSDNGGMIETSTTSKDFIDYFIAGGNFRPVRGDSSPPNLSTEVIHSVNNLWKTDVKLSTAPDKGVISLKSEEEITTRQGV